MAEQEQQYRGHASTSGDDIEEVGVDSVATEQAEELKEQIDDVIDEIDEALESNAEEFVKSYIQKGGE